MRGFDTDNGSEFKNEVVIECCRLNAIEFTRTRPYQKDYQVWVEQENGSVVHRLVGYRRFEGLAAVGVLSHPYDAARLYVNCFQPSFELTSKARVGAKVTRRYDVPVTPCAKLLAADSVTEEPKGKLRAVAASLDPLRLPEQTRSMRRHLVDLAAGEVPSMVAKGDPELEDFLKSLGTAWQNGEV